MDFLCLQDVRQVEDIAIRAIQSGLLQGRLNTRHKSLVVTQCVSRDTSRESLATLVQQAAERNSKLGNVHQELNQMLQNAQHKIDTDRKAVANHDRLVRELAKNSCRPGKADTMTSNRQLESELDLDVVMGGPSPEPSPSVYINRKRKTAQGNF